MKIVQYNKAGNRKPWDNAPGFYHIALIDNVGKVRRSYDRNPPAVFGKSWAEKGVMHLTNFRLELIY